MAPSLFGQITQMVYLDEYSGNAVTYIRKFAVVHFKVLVDLCFEIELVRFAGDE